MPLKEPREIELRETPRFTDEEYDVLSKAFKGGQRTFAWLLGVSPTAVTNKLQRIQARKTNKVKKKKETTESLQALVQQEVEQSKKLLPAKRESIAGILDAATSIISDIVNDDEVPQQLYLRASQVLIQLAETKTRIAKEALGINAQKRFNQIVIEEIEKENPPMAKKIVERLQRDERLRYFL